jgi:D-3-phosphoglycerate dehydrogenase
MNNSGKVLIAAPVHSVLINGLQDAGYECVIHEKITQTEAPQLIADCVGVITSTRLMLDKALIDAAPKLEWIGRMGSGMEIIDVPYAARKGISCYSSPEGNRNAVAEHTVGLLLSITKHLATSYKQIKDGKWLRDENRGTELEEKTIGIIGFGNTGSALAKKLSGFDMNILAYDIHDNIVPDYVVKCSKLSDLTNADIISLHVPLKKDTFHLVNDAFISSMEKAFILINTSRGPVVDNKALLSGLRNGKIKAACMDVWEEEPLEKMSKEQFSILQECIRMPNFIITPHIAGYSYEALFKMSDVLLRKIVSPT